jgi:hypothetical protein
MEPPHGSAPITALWGLLGASTYAAWQVSSSLWIGEPPTWTQRKLICARFWIAVVFGPVAAVGFTPTIIALLHGKALPPAVALSVGLSCNYLWPLAVRALGKRLQTKLGDKAP